MDDLFEDLNAFAVIVEQSSLNKASKLLNLSQPALSRKIAKLEEELGVNLFDRRGKRLEITSTGRFVYTFALEQRQRQLRFLQKLSQHKNEAQSMLTLGASLTTLQTTLPTLVEAFMSKHPQTELKLLTGKTHEIVAFVRDKKQTPVLSDLPFMKSDCVAFRYLMIIWSSLFPLDMN